MKRLTIAFYLFAVFLSGAVVGGFAHRFYSVKSVYTAPPPRNNPDEWRKRFTEEMRLRLKLDQDQAAKLEVILDDTRAQFRQFREKHRPEMKAIHEQQNQNIVAMLNENQKAEFGKIVAEREQRAREQEKAREAERK